MKGDIEKLRAMGYDVQELNAKMRHYRVNGVDFWERKGTVFNIRTRQKGKGIDDLIAQIKGVSSVPALPRRSAGVTVSRHPDEKVRQREHSLGVVRDTIVKNLRELRKHYEGDPKMLEMFDAIEHDVFLKSMLEAWRILTN